jgi:hypothetical protein
VYDLMISPLLIASKDRFYKLIYSEIDRVKGF